MTNDKTVLVTGGAGYIGSVVVEELIREGEQVTVLDNLYQGHRAAVHPEAEFVHADLADAGAVNALFARQGFDAVIVEPELELVSNRRRIRRARAGEHRYRRRQGDGARAGDRRDQAL